MKAATGVFGEGYASCFSCLMCWEPWTLRLDEKSSQFDNKQTFSIISSQPVSQSRPMAVTEPRLPRPGWKHKVQKSFASSQTSFSARSKLRSDNASQTMQISAPFEFRHLDSGSLPFPFPTQQPSQQWDSPSTASVPFEPLQLSISPDEKISPILPYFNFRSAVSSPALAHIANRSPEDHFLSHQRSRSSNSFHIPRKQIPMGSSPNSQPVSTTGGLSKDNRRRRAYTSSDMDAIKERVASAMNEVEQIQMKINEIIERQSLYTNSRPSTAHSMAHMATSENSNRTSPGHRSGLIRAELEPIPSLPALPPAAPSFAQRLNAEVDRPQTSPIHASVHINRLEAAANVTPQKNQNPLSPREDLHPPPPLPLVLRPPLRKKKSFSRVSSWLFPEPGRNSDLSAGSVTNAPRPVKGKEGYYQCISPGERPSRRSAESADTISTWETDDGNRTAPTAWSPESTPAAMHEPSIEQCSIFGRAHQNSEVISVGVAI